MDFKISTDGDLIVSDSELLTSEDMNEIVQKAMCIIASVSHDWFYDNIGCDLEQLIGKPLNNETISEGVNLIKSNLYKSNMFEENDFNIKAKQVEDEFIGYTVFINDIYKKYNYFVIEVEIDMLKGVNVKFGGDSKCLY